MVGRANVTGVYTCKAQNEVALSVWDIPFYVDGKSLIRGTEPLQQRLQTQHFTLKPSALLELTRRAAALGFYGLAYA